MIRRRKIISHRRNSKRKSGAIGLLAALALSGVGGCITRTDVSYDATRGFAPLMNRCYVLRQEVVIDRRERAATDFEIYPEDSGGADIIDAFRRGESDGENEVSSLPPGTRLRIRKLLYVQRFLDGPHEK